MHEGAAQNAGFMVRDSLHIRPVKKENDMVTQVRET
jgi:hypothetical protein